MFALGSSSVALDNRRLPINFRNALGIEIARRCNMTRGVTSDKTRMEHKEANIGHYRRLIRSPRRRSQAVKAAR
jgi:hypothetical protein